MRYHGEIWTNYNNVTAISLEMVVRCRSWISQNIPCHWRLIDVDAFLMTRWPCWVQTRPQIDGWIMISILPFNLQCFGECRPSLKHIHVAGKLGLGSKFGGRQVKKQWKNMAHVWAHVHMIDSFQSWIHPRFPLTHQSHWEIFHHNLEWCRHRIHWLIIIIFPGPWGVHHGGSPCSQKSSEVTMVWCLNQVKKHHVFWLKSPWCSWWFPGRPALLCNGQGFGTWDVQGNGGMNPPKWCCFSKEKRMINHWS